MDHTCVLRVLVPIKQAEIHRMEDGSLQLTNPEGHLPRDTTAKHPGAEGPMVTMQMPILTGLNAPVIHLLPLAAHAMNSFAMAL